MDIYPAKDNEQQEIIETIFALPSKYRTVIHLYYYEDYSTKEIAEITEQNESTVRQHLARARHMLKDILEKENIMKGYKDYMDNISVTPELHYKIMQKTNRQPKPFDRNRVVHRYAGMAACVAVLLLCVLTIPNMITDIGQDAPHTVGTHENGNNNGASPDVTQPMTPALGGERLSLAEARLDPDFGAYMPQNVPSQFAFNTAQRLINQDINSLMAFWGDGTPDFISWLISKPTEHDLSRLVSINDRERYDMSLYSIPLAASVPEELRVYVQDPVFISEELTLAAIQARVLEGASRQGDIGGVSFNFNILFDDVVVSISARGVSPEQVWEMISEMEKVMK